MLSTTELNMFESIARNQPRLREWLVKELGKQTDILVQAVEETQIRRAQGYAQGLKQIIANLDITLTSR
jgi:hypothetical protein